MPWLQLLWNTSEHTLSLSRVAPVGDTTGVIRGKRLVVVTASTPFCPCLLGGVGKGAAGAAPGVGAGYAA